MITLERLAKVTGGEIQGDGSVEISGINPPELAGKGDLTFAFDKQGFDFVKKSRAAAIISTVAIKDFPKPTLHVDDIKQAITVIYNMLIDVAPSSAGIIHPTVMLAGTAKIGKGVTIDPFAVIGEDSQISDDVFIGANCVLGKKVTVGEKTKIYPGVVVYDNVIIGRGVILHAGAVIGADGFGYVPQDGKMRKVPQLGKVVIEDNVEIGANTCVDRGIFGPTSIGEDTKIDNLVQISHNAGIGKNTFISAQAGVSGHSKVGDNTMLGSQSGIADHINIGRDVKIGAQSGVMERHIGDGSLLFGTPAKDAREIMKEIAFISYLFKNSSALMRFLQEKEKVGG